MTGREEWGRMMQWLQSHDSEWARMARSHLSITADLRESLAAAEAEVHELRQHCAKHVETLQALGTVLDVAGRVARDRSHAHEMVEAAIDCSPMRNIMATAYGLGPCGEPLTPKRTRKAKA